MTTRQRSISERYDEAASRYGRWWAPVLAPTALGLLDAADGRLAGRAPTRIVDLGAGTGTLALAAVRRWPTADVVAVDASAGMLGAAEREADRTFATADRRRIRFVVAAADAMPLDAGSVDLVVSSFVLQLVPSRPRALAEARRVLRPGGTLAFVTWLAGRDGRWRPDEAFDQAIEDAGIDEEDVAEEPRSGDLPSAEAAAGQVRRAGFGAVVARRGRLEYEWTAASFLEFLEHYDEVDLFSGLDEAERSRLREAARRRLARLSPNDFRWQADVVTVLATRTSRGA